MKHISGLLRFLLVTWVSVTWFLVVFVYDMFPHVMTVEHVLTVLSGSLMLLLWIKWVEVQYLDTL